MRSLVVLVGVVLVALCPSHIHSQRNIDPALQTALEAFIDVLFPLTNSTAFGMSVVMGDKLYSNGWGLADVAKGVPALNSTQFFIGSVTKSFTAVLAVKVLTEKFPELGEKVLDTTVRDLLPELDFILPDRYRSERTTFRDLLAQRLCLQGNEMHVLSGQLLSTEELFFRVRYNMEYCQFRAAPTLVHTYNNQIYAMMSIIIEAVAKRPYEELMQELWNELGMTSTTFSKVSDDYENLSERALPYYMKDDEFHPFNTEMIKRLSVAMASGGIISTSDDMAKYMKFVMNLGEVNGTQVLPKEVMQWMKTPAHNTGMIPHEFRASFDDLVYSAMSYGMGFEIATLDGWEVVRVMGNAPPYLGIVATVPALKLGVFTAANTGPPVILPHFAVVTFIYEWMKGNREGAQEKALQTARRLEREEQEVRMSELEERFKENEMILKNIQARVSGGGVAEVTGKYGSGSLGEIEITERLNEETNEIQFFFEYGPWFQGWMNPMEGLPGAHKITWVTDIVQEQYTFGIPPDTPDNLLRNTATVLGDTLVFFGQSGMLGIFQRDASLDTLPKVPWDPNSC